MITKLALFEGRVKPGMQAEMLAYVEAELTPHWQRFTGATEVRVLSAAPPQEGSVPLALMVTYPDMEAVERAMASKARYVSRDMLPAFYERFWDEVTLVHHVFEGDALPPLTR